MTTIIDLTGRKYGRLTVVSRAENDKHKKARWNCSCDCGNTTAVVSNQLRTGDTRSCGCLKEEKFGIGREVHGLSGHPLYVTWCSMKARCHNPNNRHYHCYGGKGVSICRQWRNDFKPFYLWAMANGYEKGLTIDRIRVAGNYTPSNCRFITRAANSSRHRNKGMRGRGYVCGVYQRASGNWTAGTTTDDGWKWLGTYSTKREAIQVKRNHEQTID